MAAISDIILRIFKHDLFFLRAMGLIGAGVLGVQWCWRRAMRPVAIPAPASRPGLDLNRGEAYEMT